MLHSWNLTVPSFFSLVSPVHPKEISPGCSLEGLMLKLKLQYFGHLMQSWLIGKRPWCWEGLGAGGEGDDRGWDGWMASPTRWTWVWVNSGSWWWMGRPGVLRFMGSQRIGHNWATELNWTKGSYMYLHCLVAHLSSGEYFCIVWMFLSLFITSPTEGHLVCFHILAVINNSFWASLVAQQ